MGIDQTLAKKYEDLLLEDSRLDRVHLRRGHQEYSQYEILRPGFSRLNLPWFFTDSQADFVIDALIFVAEKGFKFMPQYIFNNETGEWRHHSNQVFKERKWLGNFNLLAGKFDCAERAESCAMTFEKLLSTAKELELESAKIAAKMHIPDQTLIFSEVEKLRWILLPSEVKSKSKITGSSPFHPKSG